MIKSDALRRRERRQALLTVVFTIISVLYLMPVFLVSEIDQLTCVPYIDAVESFGLPADCCPVPSSECGDEYLRMPCRLYTQSRLSVHQRTERP